MFHFSTAFPTLEQFGLYDFVRHSVAISGVDGSLISTFNDLQAVDESFTSRIIKSSSYG